MCLFNGYLVSFALSIVPFAVYYKKSFWLNEYFLCLSKLKVMMAFSYFVFLYLLILVAFTFYDILTITHDKLWLQRKEEIGLGFILLFEVVIMVIAPFLYVYSRKINNDDKDKDKDDIVNYNALGMYFGIVILFNISNFLFGNYYDAQNVNGTNYGFSSIVPEGLAIYSKIDHRLYQFIYFNFGLLMAIGKFIGFTYLPFGMSKFVSELIFISLNENAKTTKNHNNEKSSQENLTLNNAEAIELYSSDEANQNLLISFPTNPIEQTNIKANNENEFRSFALFLFGIASFALILFIIYTKMSIIYIKLFYNICGVDCGLLAYRYDEIISLETILAKVSEYSNDYLKWNYFAFAYLLFFRMLTLIHSMSIKGISFLWIIYTEPNSAMTSYQLTHLLTNILFASFVLIYDFTYLLPDYMRFNGLDPICDYSLIQKSYCGVSFFGLVFIKISMNYHLFMYWDIIASLIFITNSILWAYRLIIIPGMIYIVEVCNITKN